MKIFEYIKSDLVRYTGHYSFGLMVLHYLKNPGFKYSFWLRLCKHRNPMIRIIAILQHRRLTMKHQIQIPRTTQIGYGLYIGHHMCVVVNDSAILGNNVNLSQFVTIGANDGKAAVIGDNVYIGPSVCIVGNVKIGSNATIGAGSVVTKDIDENATVAGVPAKLLSYNNPGRHVNRRWEVK